MLSKISELFKENIILSDKITQKIKKINQIDLWEPKSFIEKFLFTFTNVYDRVIINYNIKYITMFDAMIDMHDREKNSTEIYNLLLDHLINKEIILLNDQNTKEIIQNQSDQIIKLTNQVKNLEEELKKYNKEDRNEL